jgi:hypothetical protein
VAYLDKPLTRVIQKNLDNAPVSPCGLKHRSLSRSARVCVPLGTTPGERPFKPNPAPMPQQRDRTRIRLPKKALAHDPPSCDGYRRWLRPSFDRSGRQSASHRAAAQSPEKPSNRKSVWLRNSMLGRSISSIGTSAKFSDRSEVAAHDRANTTPCRIAA